MDHIRRISLQRKNQKRSTGFVHFQSLLLRGSLLSILLLARTATLIAQDSVNVSTIAALTMTDHLTSVAVKGTFAYVAARDEGVYVVDCSNPSAPFLGGLTGICNGGCHRIELQDTVFTAACVSGFNIFMTDGEGQPSPIINCPDDGNHPSQLVLTSIQYPCSDTIRTVVYGCYEQIGLRTYDPQCDDYGICHYRPSGGTVSARAIELRDTIAFLALDNLDLHVVSLTTLDLDSNYTPLSVVSIPNGEAVDLALHQDYLFVAAYERGLLVFNVVDPQNCILVGDFSTMGPATSIALYGCYAAIACEDAGFQIVDLSDPCCPREVGRFNTPGTAHSVTLANNIAYVADDTSLRLYDVSNSMVNIDSIDSPNCLSISLVSDNGLLRLTWLPSVVDTICHNLNPTLYRIFRSVQVSGPWEDRGTTAPTYINTFSDSITSDEGTTYFYHVRAEH